MLERLESHVQLCVAMRGFQSGASEFLLSGCWKRKWFFLNILNPLILFAQYALLFPGEVLDRISPSYRASDSPSTKESVWALYCRSMLLWTFTNRMRTSADNSDEQIDLIYDAWAEAQSLQDSLRMHSCNLDTTLIYMCREYIYK